MCIFICFVKFFSYNDKLQICRSPVLRGWNKKGRSKFFKGFFFKFNCITSINLIVINKQCLQCVFYSLLSLQKHRVVEKGIKTISKSSHLYAPPLIKFLDLPLDGEHTEIYRSTSISLADVTASGYLRLGIPRPIRSSSSFGRLM